MNETSEKHEDILQYELNALKEIRENWFERAEERTRHIDLVRGAAFGLTFGIAGSLFVQFLYPLTEALLLGEYKPTHAFNLIVCGISLIIIAFVSINFRRQLTRAENKLKLSRKSMEIIEYAIKRRQYALDQSSKDDRSAFNNDRIQEKSDTSGSQASRKSE